MKVYVAVRKDDGSYMSDARGRVVFEDIGGLNKSLGQQYWYKEEAKKQGKKVRELYNVIEYKLTNGSGVQ